MVVTMLEARVPKERAEELESQFRSTTLPSAIVESFLLADSGSEALVGLSAAAPGTFPYFCCLDTDGTEGMRGTVTIES